MAIGHSPRGDDSHLFGGVHFDAAADVMIRLSSERQANTLGIGLDITKGNDLPDFPTEYLALDFDGEIGLTEIRHPKSDEFIDLALSKGIKPIERIIDYLRETGSADASEIARNTNLDRPNVYRYVKSDTFMTHKEGRKTLYSLRSDRQDNN